MQSVSRRKVVTMGATLIAAGMGALGVLPAAIPAYAQTTTSTTPTRRRYGRGRPGFGRGFLGGDLSAIATALNLTVAQLEQQLQAGKSIAAIAQAQNVPLQTVENAIIAAVTNRLNQAVSAGRITSAQETQELNNLQSHLAQYLNATPGQFRRGSQTPHAQSTAPQASPATTPQTSSTGAPQTSPGS